MVIIEGLEELSQLLTEETAKAAKRYLSRAGEAAAEVVLDAMATTVPVGIGILEESLTWSKKWLNDGDQTTLEINIGPTKSAYWGSFQEWGTVTEPAQHWMGRAWASSKDKCLDVFATSALGILADLENKKG